ncbi:hypothetical protein [Flavitalea sp.]|nr:hypothetical protein [Flavitalea sp.]
MKFSLFISAILFTISANAQDCNSELLVKTMGILKADSPAGGRGLKAEDLAKNKEVLASINRMIKSSYAPMGVDAVFHENYGSPSLNWQPNGYSYSIIPLNYYCEGNTIRTAHETSTYFSISTNIFDAEIYDTAQGDRLSAEGFNVLNFMPVEKDGYWYFKETDVSLGFGMTGKSNAWLITHNGKLPFAYVTKKEFLEKRKLALSNQMLQSSSGFKDVLNNNEIGKKYKEAEFKTDPEKLKEYMRMDYQPIKERYEKLLSDNEKEIKPAFDKIETQLKIPADELNKQAIVKTDPNDHLSYLFTDANDPFGKILIKPNPGYFNKKLHKSSPQFFWVHVSGNHKEPIATKFMTDIVKAVDFAVLKNMLGK